MKYTKKQQKNIEIWTKILYYEMHNELERI